MSEELKGLSRRARNCVLAAGFVNRSEIQKAVCSGALHYRKGSKIYGYGKKCHAEVVEWLGIDIKPTPKPLETVNKCLKYLEARGYKVIAPG